MSTRRVGNSVSLFPFLAVLVCAMGALIFLLLVVTRQIRAEARAVAIQEADAETSGAAPAAPKPLPPSPPPDSAVDPAPLVLDDVDAVEVDWRGMLDSLTARHRDGTRDLDSARSEVELAETRLRVAEGELARLRQDDSDSRARRAELDTKLTRLRVRANELNTQAKQQQQAIRERRAQIEAAESQFAFLPFDSATGTRRRPIFIECHPNRIEFSSEKIDLTAANLAGFTRRANPLLAGVRALVEYWSERDAAGAAAEDTDPQSRRPYVLMVVRPGGIHAYYLARKLLSRLEAPIGYELVPETMPLAWPARDRVAAAVCRAAIDQAVARRPRSGPSLAGNGLRGGFSRGRLPGLGQPKMAVPGRPGGGKSQRVTRPARESATGETQGGGLATRVIPGDETGRYGSGRRVDGQRPPNEATEDGVKDGVKGVCGEG